MENEKTYEWIGVDGQRYKYSIHSLPTDFDPGNWGNYIFAKKTDDGDWEPIYIGEGDLGSQISEKHSNLECIKEMGATHVHVHQNDSEWVRASEEHDLLESYVKVFKPFGCNYKDDREDEECSLFEI